MTIYTKQNLANEEKKPEAEVEFEVAVEEIPKKTPEIRLERQRAKKNRRMCIQFILLVCLLAGLWISTLGAIYLYRRNAARKYQGWCGVKYINKQGRQGASTTDVTFTYVDEEVVVEEDFEQLTVPKFDENDEAKFIHDFNRNITMIKAIDDSVCYILPLDREKIPVPHTFLELLYGAYSGSYIPDATEIRDDYRVVHPELDPDYVEENYGMAIADECSSFKTYKLVKVTGEELAELTTTAAPYVRRYIMFAGGNFVIQYAINL